MTVMKGHTLTTWQQKIRQDSTDIFVLLQQHLETLSGDDPAWIVQISLEQLRLQLDALLPDYQRDPDSLPLFGVPFAVKDNIDVAGQPPPPALPLRTRQRKMPMPWPV